VAALISQVENLKRNVVGMSTQHATSLVEVSATSDALYMSTSDHDLANIKWVCGMKYALSGSSNCKQSQNISTGSLREVQSKLLNMRRFVLIESA